MARVVEERRAGSERASAAWSRAIGVASGETRARHGARGRKKKRWKEEGEREREREREESRPSRGEGARGGEAVEARRDREESARTHTKRRTVSRGGLGGESEAVGWRRVGW